MDGCASLDVGKVAQPTVFPDSRTGVDVERVRRVDAVLRFRSSRFDVDLFVFHVDRDHFPRLPLPLIKAEIVLERNRMVMWYGKLLVLVRQRRNSLFLTLGRHEEVTMHMSPQRNIPQFGVRSVVSNRCIGQ